MAIRTGHDVGQLADVDRIRRRGADGDVDDPALATDRADRNGIGLVGDRTIAQRDRIDGGDAAAEAERRSLRRGDMLVAPYADDWIAVSSISALAPTTVPWSALVRALLPTAVSSGPAARLPAADGDAAHACGEARLSDRDRAFRLRPGVGTHCHRIDPVGLAELTQRGRGGAESEGRVPSAVANAAVACERLPIAVVLAWLATALAPAATDCVPVACASSLPSLRPTALK